MVLVAVDLEELVVVGWRRVAMMCEVGKWFCEPLDALRFIATAPALSPTAVAHRAPPRHRRCLRQSHNPIYGYGSWRSRRRFVETCRLVSRCGVMAGLR